MPSAALGSEKSQLGTASATTSGGSLSSLAHSSPNRRVHLEDHPTQESASGREGVTAEYRVVKHFAHGVCGGRISGA